MTVDEEERRRRRSRSNFVVKRSHREYSTSFFHCVTKTHRDHHSQCSLRQHFHKMTSSSSSHDQLDDRPPHKQEDTQPPPSPQSPNEFIPSVWYEMMSQIHPGHFLVVASIPFLWRAHSGLRRSSRHLERLKHKLLHQDPNNSIMQQENDAARKAFGAAVASRALGVATHLSLGASCLLGAATIYWTGASTTQEFILKTRNWAHERRRSVDHLLGIQDRIDKDHPEVLLTQHMTEEEEMEHISAIYLPDEQWQEIEEKTNAMPTDK